MTANLNCLGSVCGKVHYPITQCDAQAKSVTFSISFMGEIVLNAVSMVNFGLGTKTTCPGLGKYYVLA